MKNIYQKTLLTAVGFEGIALHSGRKSNIRIYPGKENSGIIFKRIDLKKNNLVVAIYSNVSSAKLCTTI